MTSQNKDKRLYGRGSCHTLRSRRLSWRRAVAFQDLERGHGFALIDPHGDLVAPNAERVYVSMLTTTVDDQKPQLLTQEIACDTEATIYSKTRSPLSGKA